MLAMDDRKDADAAADDMKRREASGGPGPNVPLAARADVMEQVRLMACVSLPSALPSACEAGEAWLAQAWLLCHTVQLFLVSCACLIFRACPLVLPADA